MTDLFTLNEIRAAATSLAPYIESTPVVPWPRFGELTDLGGARLDGTTILAKLELFQVTGSFKPRGALTVMQHLSAETRRCGVVAASGGNHAIAVAYAAHILGVHAKVILPRTANPARLTAAKRYNAEIELVDSIHTAFERASAIASAEGRAFVHPFDGPLTALGTATLGVEFAEQAPALDLVVVAIGGGGLAGGVSRAIKLLSPQTEVVGVEPFGADSMWRSFEAGAPIALERITTIADSLGAPRALPYSFDLCRQNLSHIVRVTDEELRDAMRLCFYDLKLAVEPAGAAVVAAILGPLGERLQNKRVGLIVCGSNIDPLTYRPLVDESSRTAVVS